MKKILLLCCLFIGLTTAGFCQTNHQATPDPVVKAKGLQKHLKLSDEQTNKIAVIYKDSETKFEKIKTDTKGNKDKMLADIGPLRTATIKKVKTVLTPSQASAYDKMVKAPSSGGYGWSDGWSPASEN